MAVTEPSDLVGTSWSGDTAETAVTNDPENKGFPARTQDGELVFIVQQKYEHQTKVLYDADGNQYVDSTVGGFLVPYSSEELVADAEPEATDGATEVGGPDQAVAETPEAVAGAVQAQDLDNVEQAGQEDTPFAG